MYVVPRFQVVLIRLAHFALVAVIALAMALPTEGVAQGQVFTIRNFSETKQNLSPKHAQAWRIFEYYRITRVKRAALEAERDFLKREIDLYKTSGPIGGGAGLAKDNLGARYRKAIEEIEEVQKEIHTVSGFWTDNAFDIHVGLLPDDFDRLVIVRYEDPEGSGNWIERKVPRIEYRLLIGKQFKVFQTEDPVYVGDRRTDPVNVPDPEVPATASDECPPCPIGKQMCYCAEGRAICYDPDAGETCMMPTSDEACTGPGCPQTNLTAGGINSLLRGN